MSARTLLLDVNETDRALVFADHIQMIEKHGDVVTISMRDGKQVNITQLPGSKIDIFADLCTFFGVGKTSWASCSLTIAAVCCATVVSILVQSRKRG